MTPRALVIACALAVGCARETPPTPAHGEPAPARAAPSLAVTPNASAPESVDASVEVAARGVSGRVARFESGPKPVVVLDRQNAELRLLGIDGKAIGWRVDDEVIVDGPPPDSGAIDCTDPSRCSAGLASGGDVVLHDVDAHSGAVVVPRMVGTGVVVVGRSRRASVELRATSSDVLARAFAAAFGLSTKRHRSIQLFGPPATIDAARPRRIPTRNRKVDLHLVGAELSDVTRLFSDIAKQPMNGELRGAVSMVARNADSTDMLDAYFALCGIGAAARAGQLKLTQSTSVCTEYERPEPRCPRPTDRSRATEWRLACIAPEKLRVLALGFPEDRDPFALLGAGPPSGDEIDVRRGVFLGQSERIRTDGSEIEVNWRVSKISRDGVELDLDPELAGEKPRRLMIAVP